MTEEHDPDFNAQHTPIHEGVWLPSWTFPPERDYFARRGEATTPLPYSSGFASGTTWPFWLATGQRATLTTRIDRLQLRRDASITGLEPRPDLGAIFPLPVYRDPAPRAPFTDEPDLLTDASRPLVLYQWSADRVMALVKDLSPGVNSVRIVR